MNAEELDPDNVSHDETEGKEKECVLMHTEFLTI